jgi:membrane fusion protein, heavy metal efflux system
MKSAFLFVLLTAVALRAAEPAIDPKRAANTVVLDETGVQNLRIKTEPVEEEDDFEETVFALGRIEVLPGKRAVVSTRIEGRAQTVLGKEDMKCEAGDELLWVESRQPGDPPPVIRVLAPIGGIIAKVNVAEGQPVKPDDSLMEIYDLGTVEAVAAVPEHFAGSLTKDLEAHIRVPGYPDKVWDARLAHVGVTADEASGTLEAAFHVPNEDGALRPGMRAEFSIVLSKREDVMSVPRSALQGDAVNRYVYVKDFDLENAFIKTPVVVGQVNDRAVEIISGLLPADEVVTRGAYSLAFAGSGTISLKEALDAAHGHEHNPDGSEMTAEQKAAHEADKSGHEHHEGEGGGSLLWKIVSGILAVLLVLTQVLNRRGAESAEGSGRSKP